MIDMLHPKQFLSIQSNNDSWKTKPVVGCYLISFIVLIILVVATFRLENEKL